MRDYLATLWLADPVRLEEAQAALISALTANSAVLDPAVRVHRDNEDEVNRWLSVAFDWDPTTSARVDDDFKLDELTDAATVAGLIRVLAEAGIEVLETFDELA